jgi:hypothetical protein
MTLIDQPDKVEFTDGVLTVIVHDYSHEWHCYKMFLTEYDVTTLADISNDFPNVEMLIAENPLNGKIYRFNNYKDDKWYETGKTDGYA